MIKLHDVEKDLKKITEKPYTRDNVMLMAHLIIVRNYLAKCDGDDDEIVETEEIVTVPATESRYARKDVHKDNAKSASEFMKWAERDPYAAMARIDTWMEESRRYKPNEYAKMMDYLKRLVI